MPKDVGTIKVKRIRIVSMDKTLSYAIAIDPNLEQWRVLAAEWIGTLRVGKSIAIGAIRTFLQDYIHGQRLETDPAKFLRAGYRAPCLHATCLGHLKSKSSVLKKYAPISRFLAYVLISYYSVEDDHGVRLVPPEFRNPIPPIPEVVDGLAGENHESDKNVLPYHFIGQLRGLLCPAGVKSFSGWKWAQAATDTWSGGSWFVVPSELIDKTDPDCVWRLRKSSSHERKKFNYGKTVHELWSPVVAVALYIKLQLPLRTYQVRMLDSGEADSSRYEMGKWVKNIGPLAKGTESLPFRRGVFRQMMDEINHVSMTGLYINTNKTADLSKEEGSRGYTIPWDHPDVLPWLEKLRNWQTKYNPIDSPMPWTNLKLKHTGSAKTDSTLKAMGSTCFLFRDAASKGEDRFKPIADHTGLGVLWFKLLRLLEEQCAENNVRDLAGNLLVFTRPGTNPSTYYPMHSLRVSLITAYALEGGVPMAILSKCIAGHSRLLMTIYYIKAGITYCTDVMDAATKQLLISEQENFARWLKDKSYEQIESTGAFNDPAAIRAIMQAMQQYGPSLVKDDKGFCPKGGWGCDSGGVYVNEDTGRIIFGEVPGYPQKNCPRCRWFFTGPAFIDGLNNHWNYIQTQMGDVGDRVSKLEQQIFTLEDELLRSQEINQPFLGQDELNALRKIYQAEVEKNNKFAEDSSATYRLIARCSALLNKTPTSDGIQLVSVGTLGDVRVAIEECTKLQQILTAVAGSTIYPEHDISKLVLEAGKAYDMMLASNGKDPVFFKLAEEELQAAVAHITRLLAAETGSIKNAIPFFEGKRQLSEIGLDIDIVELARSMASSEVIRLGSNFREEIQSKGQRRLTSPIKPSNKENSNGQK